ncbi:MerR family transcriptional regulator [Streptomyces flavofungini]|uniref:MerR family transcriptional regulator n=1 Tax=Streptomyces flavofungini TaxID=68200 RepID=A0ABS0X8E6_9ACTN|nr:MerR family transcriptional regulator [Streptomyces flavofungini]MBJ3809448.1 MerR family transcriptional regulator [Streptomyces flavofungini]GHC78336.1 MerR family transcriptional regulator [Streptomyces flavofungini]
MRIGELAAATGVSVRALRYYEEQDLLSADRSPSGQRHYRPAAVERVRLIQQLYAAGLASKAIVDLLPCIETDEVAPQLLERLRAERARLDGQITGMLATRDRLDAAIALADDARERGRPCPR